METNGVLRGACFEKAFMDETVFLPSYEAPSCTSVYNNFHCGCYCCLNFLELVWKHSFYTLNQIVSEKNEWLTGCIYCLCFSFFLLCFSVYRVLLCFVMSWVVKCQMVCWQVKSEESACWGALITPLTRNDSRVKVAFQKLCFYQNIQYCTYSCKMNQFIQLKVWFKETWHPQCECGTNIHCTLPTAMPFFSL